MYEIKLYNPNIDDRKNWQKCDSFIQKNEKLFKTIEIKNDE